MASSIGMAAQQQCVVPSSRRGAPSFAVGRQAAPCLNAKASTMAPAPLPCARTVPCTSAVDGRRAPSSRTVLCRGAVTGLTNLPLDKDLDEPIPGFDSIQSALEDLREGKFVVVLDDEDRENEGDLIAAADKMTTESMAYMVEYTSGVICISMEGKDLDRLRLPLMVNSAENEEAMYTAFTVTVDLKDGITTGISASDRAKTIRHLASPDAVASDFRRPGHIFPLRYRDGGVLVRPGHTEAGVDLARLAGCYPAGVLCEIVNKADGSMARTPQLVAYAREHNLKCITIADLVRYRLRHEQLVTRAGPATALHTPLYGQLSVQPYNSVLDDSEHMALVAGRLDTPQGSPVPVYVHHESSVGDVLGVGAGQGLHAALKEISAQGQGVVVCLRSRLDGHVPSPSAELQQAGASQQGDIRLYGQAAQILRDLGVTSVSVVGGDAEQAAALKSCGLQVHANSRPAAAQHHVNGSSGSSNGLQSFATVR